MSVPDVSGKAIVNLDAESPRHVAPTLRGDTIHGEATVLDKRESDSKPRLQDDTLVYVFRRKVMVFKREYAEAAAAAGTDPERPAFLTPA